MGHARDKEMTAPDLMSDEELEDLEKLRRRAHDWDANTDVFRECWVWVKHDSHTLIARLRSAEEALTLYLKEREKYERESGIPTKCLARAHFAKLEKK